MTSMRAHGLLLVTVLTGAALVAGAGCLNAIPDRPSYERDIKPLMEAHCIRCHGAGGTLNTDPDIPPPPHAKVQGPPLNSDFTSLQGENGHFGLMNYTLGGSPGVVFLKTYVEGTLGPMPPPPADPLTNWERDLLFTWANNPLP
jgi:mono/diheme cytochrome c family protein